MIVDRDAFDAEKWGKIVRLRRRADSDGQRSRSLHKRDG
jgi:hypothetical protein